MASSSGKPPAEEKLATVTIQAQDQFDPEKGQDGGDSPRDDQQQQKEHDEGGNSTDEHHSEDKPDDGLVRWDGPDDPENPRNWTKRRKWITIICVSCFTLISPVASSIVAPGLPAIAKDLHITQSIEQALALSVFVAAYALGPVVWGPLSEFYGRAIIIQVSNVWFLLFNLGCGLARNKQQMFAFRFLAGIGGSAPMAIGAGVVGDLFTAEERGSAIGIYSMAPVLGPALGPLAGGWIVQRVSWRWVFFASTIACGAVQAAGLLFLRETFAPVVLGRKRDRIARETGIASAALRTELDLAGKTRRQTLLIALTRPFRMLATQPIVQLLSLYMMYIYGLIYLVLSTFASLWATEYGEASGIDGLNYLSIGLGFLAGAQVTAPLQDRIYAALKRRYAPDGGPGRPEFRVPLLVPSAVLLPAGLLVYSWTAQAHTHWIWPNVGAFVFSAALIVAFQCVQAYLVDAYTRYAASAVGVVTILRSLAGFGFPLFAPAMYDRLGYGKGGTILAAIAIAIGWPSPILLWIYGERLRAAGQFST
ncbi:putative transporter [Escovopsis weberi]|uniref:Putative transporter n=1 Tax=Escovopsis weberi TaxID=150374 RepID=A0A0M8N7M3_ESCWE|nr:putative transporter [Escovopsis weberi]